ncbi:MAG: hypothetical protein M9894_24320 [Planctomycetes bacterium]|nr:hypothetical protein [Planctomycetota bacterium]
MIRRLLTCLLLAAALAAPALRAQDGGLPPPGPRPGTPPAPEDEEGVEEEAEEEPAPDAPPATPPKPLPPPPPKAADGLHRVQFKREQGTAEALKGHLERTLAAFKAGEAAALGEALRAMAPDEAALKDAFTDDGFKALAPRILERAPQLFAGEPAEVARRLGLRADLETVEVFTASTEDLQSMESGTDAAREFASGLRRTAQHLKPRYHWYCAVLKAKGPAGEDPTHGTRLQLFFYRDGKFVLLGRIWRIEDE